MFISLVIDPAAFSPEEITGRDLDLRLESDQPAGAEKEAIEAQLRLQVRYAKDLLAAIYKNGVLLSEHEDVLADLYSNILKMGRFGSDLGVLLADIKINEKRYVERKEDPGPKNADANKALLNLAEELRADAIICKNSADLDRIKKLAAEAGKDLECCLLKDYERTLTEVKRRAFRDPDRHVGEMEKDEREDWLGRIVRYARKITVADRYVGRNTEYGSGKKSMVDKALNGLAYLARIWNEKSPHSKKGPVEIELLTEAENVRSKDLESEITKRFRSRKPIGCSLNVSLVRSPPKHVFHDRFLAAKQRCVMFVPGLDTFSDEDGGEHLVIHLHSSANMSKLQKIRDSGRDLPEEDLSPLSS